MDSSPLTDTIRGHAPTDVVQLVHVDGSVLDVETGPDGAFETVVAAGSVVEVRIPEGLHPAPPQLMVASAPTPAAIEDLRRHLLGVVASVREIEVDVGWALPSERDVAQADLAELLVIARHLSDGVCEVL